MSYILDALKRAEQARSQTPFNEPLTASARAQELPRLRPTTLALAAATLFLAGIGAASLWRARAPMPPPTTSAATAAAPVTVHGTMTPKPVPPQADSPELMAYDSLDDVAPVYQGSVSALPAVRDAADDEPAPSVGRVTVIEPPAASIQPSPSTPPAADDDGRVPTLGEMPAAFRAQFPALQVQVHVYDANPAKRWMMIDNRRYNQGNVLGSGPRLIEIRANGAVFELEGEQVFWPLQR
ncbi:general secretion pathway protein GspB [Sinimarinibacterium sp. NLF-5-8]|uniref:general secretion pathway protein GspB n=1 Tax=Sinimarinibacterium sp. NLF-5-8 TaxID=2698684 RepID=UPI00137C08F7|nr:general secretion pathway protein GspB [Sinimarinibacterium sp. NLF-5-8]QHS10135.1 GspB domain-containing protein [Sinimarinibacterium sp. NLF-5-8]